MRFMLSKQRTRRFVLAVSVILIGAVFPRVVNAQTPPPPICDVTCSPNPTSSTYTGGTVQARPLAKNERGMLSVLSAVAFPGPPERRRPTAAALAGSSSYAYAIPILNLPGRNGLNVNLTLYYNSAIWTVDTVHDTATFNASRDFPSYGFRLGYGTIEGPFNLVPNSGLASYLLTEPDGTVRELRQLSTASSATESADNSHIAFDYIKMTLQRNDGTRWQYVLTTGGLYLPTQITDTNGNFITIAYNKTTGFDPQSISQITDTLGRVITFNYNSTGMLQSISVPSFGGLGATNALTLGWSQIALNYNYASSFKTADTVATGTAINVITGCSYPNGTAYKFVYGDWGIIDEIEQVSSSGAIRSSQTYNFPAVSFGALADAPTYTQETVFDGVQSANWNYQITKSGDIVSSEAITDPNGFTTRTNLAVSGWQTGLVTSTDVEKNSVVLHSMFNTYTQDNTSVSYPTNPRLINALTFNDAGQQSQVSYSYDSFGNVNQVQEYGFGNVFARKTQTDFQTSSAYTALNILNRPLETRIYDASGNLVDKIDYAYDSMSSLSVTVTGAKNHDDTDYGSAMLTRGNLSSTTRYPTPSSTTGAITRNFTYDTAGNLRTAQVDCCQSESINYSSITQYAFPDSVTKGTSGGTQLTTSQTYDNSTGLVTSMTDANGQKTTYSYNDAANRLTETAGPLGSDVKLSYNDSAGEASSTASTLLDTSTNARAVSIVTTDGLGHVVQQQTQNVSGAVQSTVQSKYDGVGQLIQSSNPFGPSETAQFTTNTYDGLGRITLVTPPGNVGSYQFSYSGGVVLATDPAGKQRRSTTDAFGRLVEVDEPGWGSATSGSGAISITGQEQWVCTNNNNLAVAAPAVSGPSPCPPPETQVFDSGTVSVTVDSFTASASYGQTSTAATIAQSLVTKLNVSTSPVTATLNSSTITMVAKASGSSTNYTVTISTSFDSFDFGGPSFSGNPNPEVFQGGTDANTPSDPNLQHPFSALYTYDPLDELTKVSQGVQTRTYIYNGLQQLVSASTPEAGTVGYTYTSFGDVLTKTDARGVVTTYGYDTLNRLTGVSYNVGATGVPATASVGYSYDSGTDALGRLSGMTDGVGSETYTYNALGQMTKVTKVVGGKTYTTTYAYNAAGELTSITYPSGRVVQQTFDSIGRLNQVQSSGTNYLSGVAYNGAGQPTGFSYGNGVAAVYGYNARNQLASLAYSKGSSMLFSLAYQYTSTSTSTDNNGQIRVITDNVDSTKTATYAYDAVGRLQSATTGQWGLQWSYDQYGNRLSQSVTLGSGPSNSISVNPATNRINTAPYAYDASGNLTNDALNAMTYDAEDHVVANVQGGATSAYTYDGNGLRVEKTASGTTTVYIFSGSKVVDEYDNGAAVTAPTREYIYAGSQLLATISGGATTYVQADHLSIRLVTDANGNVVGQQGHYPFGESWYSTGTNTKWKFTSYERDAESANDYAMARYDVNRLGRFGAPDPIEGNPAAPQSLNRYSYTANDPINAADPSGLHMCSYLLASTFYDNGDVSAQITFLPDCFLGGPSRPEPATGGDTGGSGAGKKSKKCITEALEAVIAAGEGTDTAPNGGYGTLVYGTIASANNDFSDLVGDVNSPSSPVTIDNPELLKGNPQIYVQVHPGDPPKDWSSAFGRYQITNRTAQFFGFKDFSPAGQDAAAATMLQFYDAIEPAMEGNFQQAIWNMWAWQSMPDSPLGGNQMSWSKAEAVYQHALKTLPDCQ